MESRKLPKRGSIPCYCGKRAQLQFHESIYHGRSYGSGMSFVCENYAKCGGAVGTHPDGKPLGFIVSPETKKLRMELHDIIDGYWHAEMELGVSKTKARGSVYAYLGRLMGTTPKETHVAQFNHAQLKKAIAFTKLYPYQTKGVIDDNTK